jgi:hypothetical protein
LNRALKNDDLEGADPALIKRWCEFYSEQLLPQTRAMVKKTSAKLDAYGLFLPSRMGASLSPETLEKGLKAEELAPGTASSQQTAAEEEEKDEESTANGAEPDEEDEDELSDGGETKEATPEATPEAVEVALDEGGEYDEYEYEEEEYYDDEDA